MTGSEEERAEAVITKFINNEDDWKALNFSSMKEMAYGLVYMKRMLIDKDTKYNEEIEMLKLQVNELKKRLTEFIELDNTPTIRHKENEDEGTGNLKIKVIPQVSVVRKKRLAMIKKMGDTYRQVDPSALTENN